MTALFVVLVLVLAGCGSGASRASVSTPPARGESFRALDLRQPALLVRVEFGSGTFSERERENLPRQYEGALLEAFNARGVLARDVRLLGARERFDAAAGLARAREVGADHAIVVDVRVTRGESVACGDRRRSVRVAAMRWSQGVEVIRATDGLTRLTVPRPGVEVTDVETDCDDPKNPARRTVDDTVTEAAERLAKRLLGS